MQEIERLELSLFQWLLDQSHGEHFDSLEDRGAYLLSSQGVFRARNEDRAVYIEVVRAEMGRSPLVLAAIADGMGGHADGDKAASAAISALSAFIACGEVSGGLKSLLLQAVRYADKKVFSLLGGQGGTTLSAILFGRQGAIAINIGDSRIYSVVEEKCHRLTVDDTLAERLGKVGDNLEDESSVIDGRLIQFVGMGGGIEPNIIDLTPNSLIAQSGYYILTSDGAHSLGERNFSAVVRRDVELQVICKSIVDISRLLGSKDNASVVCCPINTNLPTSNSSPFIKVFSPKGQFYSSLQDLRRLSLDVQEPRRSATSLGLIQTHLFEPYSRKEKENKSPQKKNTKGLGGRKTGQSQSKAKRPKRGGKSQAPSLEILSTKSKSQIIKKI